MKKLALLLALLWALPASAAITMVQTANNLGTANTSIVGTFVNATVAGNNYIVLCRSGNQAGWSLSVSDSEGNTWQSLTAAVQSGAHMSQVFYVENAIGGTKDGITCTQSSGISGTMAIVIFEYSGLATTSSLDCQAQTAGTSNTSTLTGAACTTTNANDLVIGAAGLGGDTTWSAGAGFTVEGSDARLALEDKVVAATGSQQPTIGTTTTATSWTFTTAAFKAAGGGGATPPPPQLMNMGVGQLAYNINYTNLAAFNANGCVIGDTTCSEEAQLCDERNNCLHFPPGPHTLTLNFAKNGVPMQVASSTFTVTQ